MPQRSLRMTFGARYLECGLNRLVTLACTVLFFEGAPPRSVMLPASETQEHHRVVTIIFQKNKKKLQQQALGWPRQRRKRPKKRNFLSRSEVETRSIEGWSQIDY